MTNERTYTANEMDECFLEGVRLGAGASASIEAEANWRSDMAAKNWNEIHELVAESSQKIVDLKRDLADAIAALEALDNLIGFAETVRTEDFGDWIEEYHPQVRAAYGACAEFLSRLHKQGGEDRTLQCP